MNIKKMLVSSAMIISAMCMSFLTDVRAKDDGVKPNFEVIVRPSTEEHLTDGMIEYVYMGINSGPEYWGTTKFEMSVDGGKTWYYAYCLNNDLNTPDYLLNKNIEDFDHLFNNQNIKKILYYGYNNNYWDSEGYEYVRKNGSSGICVGKKWRILSN